MKRSTALLAVALAVIAVVAMPVHGTAAGLVDAETQGQTRTPEGGAVNGTANEPVPPGARLAGVVNVQGAEVRGEVDSRAFGHRLANASSPDAKASVVASQVREIDERLETLEERRETLRERRANGSMSRGEFRARMARLVAETRHLRRLANRSANVARGLPADALEREGINVTAIRQLKREAANLTGPEVAEIARSIAGRRVGAPIDRGPPEERGPPGERGGNATDRDGGPPEDRGPDGANESRGSNDPGQGRPGDRGEGTDRGDSGNATDAGGDGRGGDGRGDDGGRGRGGSSNGDGSSGTGDAGQGDGRGDSGDDGSDGRSSDPGSGDRGQGSDGGNRGDGGDGNAGGDGGDDRGTSGGKDTQGGRGR